MDGFISWRSTTMYIFSPQSPAQTQAFEFSASLPRTTRRLEIMSETYLFQPPGKGSVGIEIHLLPKSPSQEELSIISSSSYMPVTTFPSKKYAIVRSLWQGPSPKP
jgi:hypothetical protein